jgi:lipopolysaccharide/colanic/teichoic acid biosynthesis glycosyltransferase
MYKFRSMTNETDKDGNHLADGRRLTRLGRFLRSWSLDELPEFFNVLKGEMSLVGPRPQLKEYYELMNDHQRRRYEVLPGVTGLAQIKGRNGITWNERFEIDVWYVDHRSLWLDLKILLLTPYKVLKREGISAPGEVTMSKFRGNIPSVDEEV